MAEREKNMAGFIGNGQQKTGPETEKPDFAQSENGNGNQPHISPTGFKCYKNVSLATEVWPR